MKRRLPKTIISLGAFTALIFLLLFSLWGVKPTTTTPFIQIGHFRLSQFTKGLALYQQDKPYFYDLSPYDDYFIDQNGEYETLITKEDIMEGRFKINSDQNPIKKRIDYFSSLFGFYQPIVTYQNQSQIIKYRAEINGNSIEIIRELSGFPQLKQEMARGIIISFGPNDYVLDQQLNLIQNEGESPMLWEEVPFSFVFILNPKLQGAFQILAQPYQKIKINKLNHLLALEEFGELRSDQLETKMVIKIFNNFTEIK